MITIGGRKIGVEMEKKERVRKKNTEVEWRKREVENLGTEDKGWKRVRRRMREY